MTRKQSARHIDSGGAITLDRYPLDHSACIEAEPARAALPVANMTSAFLQPVRAAAHSGAE